MKISLKSFISKHLLLLVITLISSTQLVLAQHTDDSPLEFPVPKNSNGILFYLQRDPNTNTIVYTLNLNSNGAIDKNTPVNCHWIRYTENAVEKELSYIQKKFAYGVSSKFLSENKFLLKFTAYQKLPFYLVKSLSNNQFYVFTIINEKRIKVNRLFIRIDGGSFWSPNVKYFLIEGIDLSNGKAAKEKIPIG